MLKKVTKNLMTNTNLLHPKLAFTMWHTVWVRKKVSFFRFYFKVQSQSYKSFLSQISGLMIYLTKYHLNFVYSCNLNWNHWYGIRTYWVIFKNSFFYSIVSVRRLRKEVNENTYSVMAVVNFTNILWACLRQNCCAKKIQTLNGSTKKLHAKLLYEKSCA